MDIETLGNLNGHKDNWKYINGNKRPIKHDLFLKVDSSGSG